jgi:hypothetical protein
VLQSGQKVAATGVPSISSFTISCHMRIWIGVGARVVAELELDDGLARLEPLVRGFRRHESGRLDRRDAVLARPAARELAERDAVLREVRLPARGGDGKRFLRLPVRATVRRRGAVRSPAGGRGERHGREREDETRRHARSMHRSGCSAHHARDMDGRKSA